MRVEPLPDIATAAACQVEERRTRTAGKGVDELSLDGVVVLL